MAVWLSALRAGRHSPPARSSGTHFAQKLHRPQDHNVARRIRSIEKSSDLIEIQTFDLAVYRLSPQPSTLQRRVVLINFKKTIEILFTFCLANGIPLTSKEPQNLARKSLLGTLFLSKFCTFLRLIIVRNTKKNAEQKAPII
jgi:hypothetical protein